MENYQVADADTPLPTLVGPNNFCVAIRNPAIAEAIADELNRLAAEVERLREEQAFWRKHLSVASPKMDSQHIWRLFNGWPPLVGPDADAVVRNALEAIRTQPLPAPPEKEE